MAKFGIDVKTLGRILGKQYPSLVVNDLALDALFHLALAYNAIEMLNEYSVADLEIGGRPIVTPGIERAYRELLYVRSRMPGDHLDTSIITRYGRYVGESKV